MEYRSNAYIKELLGTGDRLVCSSALRINMADVYQIFRHKIDKAVEAKSKKVT
jgi:hypothetical protein